MSGFWQQMLGGGSGGSNSGGQSESNANNSGQGSNQGTQGTAVNDGSGPNASTEGDITADVGKWFEANENDYKPAEVKIPSLEGNNTDILKEFGNIDFVSEVATPELLAKITEGGEAGVQATILAMNKVAQQTSKANFQITQNMIRQALAESSPVVESKVNETLRSSRIDSGIKAADPFYSTPVGRPLFEGIKSAITAKFPNATESEITDYAKRYLTSVRGEQANQNEPAKETAQVSDWDSFLN